MDELGEFLRSRRARLRPADVDLEDYGEQRRVPGLRHDRPNWAHLFFLDPHVRALFGDGWRQKARDTVSDLRMIAARRPDDLALAELVGELTMRSPEFAALWSAHPVRGCAHHTRDYHHPLVGTLALTDDLLTSRTTTANASRCSTPSRAHHQRPPWSCWPGCRARRRPRRPHRRRSAPAT